MIIQKQEGNIYTKGLDKVDAHLVNIISRFFQTDQEEIKLNIEQIIEEAVRRTKEDLINRPLEIEYAVTSVNKKYGNVILEAKDVGAEPAFSKNTAFNKNFGDSSKTVCEGNDPRLSDKREPMFHEHAEYIKTTDVEDYILQFLADRGVFFDANKVIVNNCNLEIINGELVEK